MSPTTETCKDISRADLSDIEGATYGHADMDCVYNVILNGKDYIRGVPAAWCAKIHCDLCDSGAEVRKRAFPNVGFQDKSFANTNTTTTNPSSITFTGLP